MGTIEAKANQAKRDNVAILEGKLEKAQGIYFADFSGLTVAQINQLRGKFFEAGDVEFVVAKNTLINIALNNTGHKGVEDGVLAGPTAMAIGYEDPVAPAKIISDFAKDNKKPEFKGALVEGEFLATDKIKELADLPPMDQLRGMIVGALQSPLSDFVGVLNEIVRSFVGVLDAIIEKKKAEEAA